MRYETVKPSFWDEPDFEDWDSDTRLLYLWLMTNPYGHGISGVSRASTKMIERHTGLSPERQAAAFVEMGSRASRYDGHWIWLRARLTHTCQTVYHWKSVSTFLLEPTTHVQLAIDFAEYYNSHPQFSEFAASHPLPIRNHRCPTPVPPPSHTPARGVTNLTDSEPTPNRPEPNQASSSPPKRTAPRKARAKTPGDPRVGEFERWWGVAFQERFKIPYVCQFAADGKQLKAALAGLDAGVGDTMATLERAAKRFLADDSRRKYGGHTIRNFCSQLNSYTVDEPPKPARDDETVPIIPEAATVMAGRDAKAKHDEEVKARFRAEMEAKR